MNYRLILGKLRSELYLLRLQICNHTENAKQFFMKENLIPPHYIFPHYVHILIIHCILLSKEILLVQVIWGSIVQSLGKIHNGCRSHTVKNKSHQKWSCYIPFEAEFYADYFYKNTNTLKWTGNELLAKIHNDCYQCRIKLFFN